VAIGGISFSDKFLEMPAHKLLTRTSLYAPSNNGESTSVTRSMQAYTAN